MEVLMKSPKNIPLLLLAAAFLMSVPTVQASKRSADAAELSGAASLSQDPGQAPKRLMIAKQREVCGVCLEDISEINPKEISSLYRIQPTWDSCPHRFHTACISDYLDLNDHCPSCLKWIPVKKITNNPSMKDLLEITENLNAPQESGHTLLGAACAAGCLEDVLEILSDERVSNNPGLYLNTHGSKNMPPLHWAAQFCHFAIAKILLERGAAVNNQIDDKGNKIDGITALHMASGKGNLATVKLLLEYGANPCQTTTDGFTMLHTAAFNTDPCVLQRMLEIIPQLVNQTDMHGITPLHEASAEGSVPNVTLLLNCGALIDPISNADLKAYTEASGSLTPLHLAVLENKLDIVQFLVQRGADVYARTSDNQTARDIAEKKHNNDIADFLAQAEASALPSALPAAP
jgi:ankyrin repeat protein